jgi:ABC-type Zn uptake system ZnuABC Zn-binding protein ZnuA
MARPIARMLATGIAVALAMTAAVTPTGAAGLRIVATLPDLWTLTRAVIGDAATVDLATRMGQNPHDMEIRPSQTLLVRRAEVLVRNGLEEDAWIDPVVEGAGNPKLLRGSPNVIEAARGIAILKIPTGLVDRSMGDVHPSGNPHYTLDPGNVPIVTPNIATGLARLAPDLAPRLEANRRAFLERVATADRRWKATLAPLRGAKVVSYHDSWPYFYQAFGLVEGGVIENRPGVPPAPQHVASLIRKMKDERIRVILLETWYPADTANLVAREAGARVVVVPQSPGAVKGTEDYIAHIDALVNAVADALR